MADWFVLQPPEQPLAPARKVFVTGAPGRIGSGFASACHERYALTLMAAPDEDAGHVEGFGQLVRADLAEKDRLAELMADHDAVVHLAATPNARSTWDELLAPNVVGCHNAFAAAHAAGVKRVVFASSIHAVGTADRHHQVHPAEPVTPANLYGVSKAFGEALARYYAEREGMACFPIRIGAYRPEGHSKKPGTKPSFCDVSWGDMNRILCACLDTTTLRFAIVHGLSRNDHEQMDITQLREMLGYEPADDYRIAGRDPAASPPGAPGARGDQ